MLDRFYELSNILIDAYYKEDFDKVHVLSNEYLDIAAQNKDNWNYGNAIHVANTLLGLVALKKNNIEKAKEYLISAAQTPGSPQLRSFGPNMLLARELLKKGETEVVLNYIQMCKSFWFWLFRWVKMCKWNKKIKKGEIPNFRAHNYYHMLRKN